ncbi:SNF1-interacting protein [Vanrija albida]|uniref:SNF1-interacting protein n=1 Tax=Vanrija albida TaxID=181172 RepID=A0ABR3PST9_9TREE
MGNTSSQPAPASSGRGASANGRDSSAPPGAAAAAAAAASSTGPVPPPKPPSPAPPQTPLLLPFAGHLSPQNPHALGLPQTHDYSKLVVTELILEAQLAPFYRGLDDFEEDWEEDAIKHALDEAREKDFQEDVNNSYTHRLKVLREGGNPFPKETPADKDEHDRREVKAYLGAVECPICFLSYPPNINTSRCCEQPLCTECFVQMKRSEATVTHLESDSACCPYCMEPDFGVIYERPSPPRASPAAGPTGGVLISAAAHALSTSPDAGTSGFSQALSLSEDTPLSSSPAPSPGLTKPEGTRRKSVSSKAKEVITIDQIRPDWEAKLNAVKAAAARRAARRIVMRQVGDRLIPIGYTSARATGQADFSMSIPQEEGGSGRRSRRNRDREREMEEQMMIMEAMRLSLLDHEEHQRKSAADNKPPSGSTTPVGESSSRRSSSATGTFASWKNNSNGNASKLLSKISGNRSRANSKSSVHFAPSPTTLGPGDGTPRAPSPAGPSGSLGVSNRARSSSSPSPSPRLVTADSHPSSPLAAPAQSRHSLDVHVPASGLSLPAAEASSTEGGAAAQDKGKGKAEPNGSDAAVPTVAVEAPKGEDGAKPAASPALAANADSASHSPSPESPLDTASTAPSVQTPTDFMHQSLREVLTESPAAQSPVAEDPLSVTGASKAAALTSHTEDVDAGAGAGADGVTATTATESTKD